MFSIYFSVFLNEFSIGIFNLYLNLSIIFYVTFRKRKKIFSIFSLFLERFKTYKRKIKVDKGEGETSLLSFKSDKNDKII